MTDPQVWQEVGLYDPVAPGAADRLALLEFLTAQGCDIEEMLEADAVDRLFAVAGDRMIRPPRPRYDADAAAQLLGVEPADVCRAWRAFGPPRRPSRCWESRTWRPSARGCSCATFSARRRRPASRACWNAGTSRPAEAEAAAMRVLGGAIDRAESGEAATARDAVMWVSPTAAGLAQVAQRLVRHPRAQEAALQVRAGIAYGDALAQDGDYFGPPVNLAARLVAVAEPGQVLASPATAPLLGPDLTVTELVARELPGLDAPVAPYLVTPA
ncbi:MAG: hypothetical protein JWN77_3283 [Frankiales bacterium]|jgi:class 3 adenylate cyclase|nr:hypothetical protein [Frankiales bacterium]